VIPFLRLTPGEDASAIAAAIDRVVERGWFILGPELEAFEAEFAEAAGARHAAGVGTGTDALHIAMRALGIGPGDEVITSPLSAAYTALAIMMAGARPVFADIDPVRLTIDPVAAAAAVTPRTAAILPVHLYGQPADMPAIADIAERHGLAVIEDAAQAHGAAVGDRKSGSWGAGAFSFYPTKNMTTGEGGMITTGDAAYAERVRLLREHGMKVRYHHDIVGYNFRMTDIAAAIGLAQLPKLDAYNARRRAIAARYDAELRGVVTPFVRPRVTHVYHQYTIRVRERDAFVERLKERGVGSAIYYPIPVHRQKPFIAMGYGEQSFPVTDRLTEQVVSIPVHPALSDEEVSTVIEAVNQTAAELGPIDVGAAAR
jgi:dTDP-4-amino-4,6-dideoxygalactose transaminase